MADDCVADLDTLYRVADLFDPTRVFMPKNVGQFNICLVAPNSLDNVQISPAYACAADSHNHISWLRNTGIANIFVTQPCVALKMRVVLVQYGGFHRLSP